VKIERQVEVKKTPTTNKPVTATVKTEEVEEVIAQSDGAKKDAVVQVANVDKQGIRNPLYFANKYLGIREDDPKQQKTIKGFLNDAVGKNWVEKDSEVTLDSRAWCAAFVDHILEEGKFNRLDTTNTFSRVRAKEYKNIGQPVASLSKATPGDLIILTNKKTGGSHVGFYAGKDGDDYTILGGNQDDQVNIKPIDTDSVDVTVRRIKDVENMPEKDLNIFYSSEYYFKDDKKLRTL
jgi:uncharacterized protein (TIGR02594 family)